MEQEDFELRSAGEFNPASCSSGPEEGVLKEARDCIQVADLQTRAREDLQDPSAKWGEGVY